MVKWVGDSTMTYSTSSTQSSEYYLYLSPTPDSSLTGPFTFKFSATGVISIVASDNTIVFSNAAEVNAITTKKRPYYLMIANDGSVIEYDDEGTQLYVFVDKMEALNNIRYK